MSVRGARSACGLEVYSEVRTFAIYGAVRDLAPPLGQLLVNAGAVACINYIHGHGIIMNQADDPPIPLPITP